MHDAVVLDFGIVVEFEDDAVCQLFLVGTKRTDEVAETLREHRDGAIYEIDRCGTLHSFLVDDAALRDVVRNISDVDTHLPVAVLQSLNTQGIIEVFGVFRVDGAGENLSEVFSLLVVLLCDFS